MDLNVENNAQQHRIMIAPESDWICERCGHGLNWIEGWAEYGDQLVEIVRRGCWVCGWIEYEDADFTGDWEES